MKKIICMLAIAIFAVGSTNIWAYSGGSGTSSSPYLIANEADLLELADNSSDYDKYFKMTADIDLASRYFTKAVIAQNIGVSSVFYGTEFTGSFDGDGHVIKNLKISSGNYCGLFGKIGYSTDHYTNGGSVKNLGLVNCNVTGRSQYVGGLCGYLSAGSIYNCYVTGSINYGSNWATYGVGGLAGYCSSDSKIANCYSSCTVRGFNGVGGLCGINSGTIRDCYSTGNVDGSQMSDKTAGGFCGNNYSTIQNCYSTGSVNASSDHGGFCGRNSGDISACFWNKNTSGYTSSYGGTCKTTVQMQTQSTYSGWDFADTWTMNGYPKLKWQNVPMFSLNVDNGAGDGSYSDLTIVNISFTIDTGCIFNSWTAEPASYNSKIANASAKNTSFTMPAADVTLIPNFTIIYSGGFGTQANPYLISNKTDLLLLANYTADFDKYFKMTADIDLTGESFTDALIAIDNNVPFTGNFDGQGHQISNLEISGTGNYVGLFGYNEGIISSIGLVDSDVSGANYVGSICGLNSGEVNNCYTASNVDGDYNVGGLCGWNYSGTVNNCYSIGTVSGASYIGGLCGYNYEGTISASFWDMETSGIISSSGGTGKTTAEMQTVFTFSSAGWDFVETWVMDGYPKLQWQPKYTLTVNTGSGDGRYSEMNQVNIAYEPVAGYAFNGWTANPASYNSNIANASAKNTTFTMPAANVTLTANKLTTYSGGSGTSEDPYLIATKSDLLQLGTTTVHYDKYFKMTADINLIGESFTDAIIAIDNNVPFTGNFDGQGHQISNLEITGASDFVGLFGSNYGTISSVGLINCDVTGANNVGGLCGFNGTSNGNVSNCYSTGTVVGSVDYTGGLCGRSYGVLNNCHSSASVSGNGSVGGLCGRNYNSICNSYSTGNVVSSGQYAGGFCGLNYSMISNCYSSGSVNGNKSTGGFCGRNYNGSTIKTSYCTGNVNGDDDIGGFSGENDGSATINNCYSVGEVSGTSNLGGFCGNNAGTISASFWDILTSGMMGSSGGTGMMTMQLQNEITFTSVGWNFVDTWVIDGYPVLKDLEASVMYKNWAEDCGIPGNKQEYYDCPTGDGIKNLMKYAIGLDPMKVCSSADIMQPLSETNRFGIVYHKSKDAKYVNLYPMWSNSLITNNWFSNGFKFTMMSETSSNETWKATFQIPISSGYIKLKAKED